MLFKQFCVTKLQALKNCPEKLVKSFLSKFTFIGVILSFLTNIVNSMFIFIFYLHTLKTIRLAGNKGPGI